MAQLTLRTLLAYIDDTLEPAKARQLGAKVAESELAQELIERIKIVTRRRRLQSPIPSHDGTDVADPNTVAEYLSDTLDSEQMMRLEETCLESDVHLAEVAACHQLLTLILTEPVRVPPQARQRMYKLVPPPASQPNRRPSKAVPVGGVAPEPRELDDADTTLLLGLGRYTSVSAVNRMALAATAVVLGLFLGVAVLMALPHRQPDPPETDRGVHLAKAAPQVPDPIVPVTPKQDPDPIVVVPPKKDPDPIVVAPPPKKVGGEDPVKGVAPPRGGRVEIGKLEGVSAIVLSRPENAPAWTRLDPAGDAVVASTDQVLCLPGYKADVQLDSGVKVHLWGNVPDLLPAHILETRVRFHRPERKADGKGDDFDADIALLAGRIYLSTNKATGSRVRLRCAGQVWDVTLPDPKAEFMIEVAASFDPGTPFAREGGALPRIEVQAAVVRGAVALAIPERSKTFDKIAAPSSLSWDSKSGTLVEPKPIDAGNGYFDRFLLVRSEPGKLVQKALTELATELKESNGIKVLLAELLTEPPEQNRIVVTQMAVYAQAAIVFGPTTGDELKPLIDVLTDEVRGYARLAAVNALAGWIAQAPGNTALLGDQLAPKIRREGEPDIILRLLRGYANPTKADPADLDRLVEYLNHANVAIRELALWNLVNFVDPTATKTPALLTDVALSAAPGYEKFVKAWKTRVDEVKAKQPMKK